MAKVYIATNLKTGKAYQLTQVDYDRLEEKGWLDRYSIEERHVNTAETFKPPAIKAAADLAIQGLVEQENKGGGAPPQNQ